MNVRTVGDPKLLDYVVEKDFEDTVSRVILSAIESHEKGVGRSRLVRLLRGKDPGAILSGRYDLLDHFGRLSLLSSDQLLDFLGSLERLGVIETKEPDFPRLHLTGKGRTAMKRRKDIPAQIPWPLPPRELPIPRDPELFSDLKKERNRIARDEGLPPYCVATNLSLAEIVNRGVTDIEELSAVPGMGETRARKYGERLLSMVQEMG
ncbi:MAG: hypothetical protein DRN57_03260 [Thermoplasmata archaeon]|nr:MAG: hypothetical protein DRN57_03260 [Thermoplasmata archaeon]